MAAPKQGDGMGVAAVDRALSILAVFEAARGPVRLSDIAIETGLYKSTVMRLVGSLEQFGYLRRLEDKRYVLGPTPFQLGRRYQQTFALSDLVLPELRRLVADGTESASFHIRDGDRRICLYRVDSSHATRDSIREGDALPLEQGAAGRVLLAFTSGPDAHAVRQQWYAISKGERDPECGSVAAPVLEADGAIAGALSVSGPLSRFSAESIAWQRDKVMATAERLTRALGGNWALQRPTAPVD